MNNKIKTKVISNIANHKKKSLSPKINSNNLEQIYFSTQTPLFKILMDNKKTKKIHLMRNSVTISKERISKREKKNDNIYFNTYIFSFKILEAKYNMNPKLFSQKIIFDLVRNKPGHLLAFYHEILLYDNSLKEFMKRMYHYKECLNKIPKYYNYYRNYLHYFCHPTFTEDFINKKMVKRMEKVAQIYYNKKYIGYNKNDNFDINIIIFNERVIKDIERISVGNNSNATKDNQSSTDKNYSQNCTNFNLTPIVNLSENNCPSDVKNSDNFYFFTNDNIQKEKNKNNLLESEHNILNTNYRNIKNIIETNNSLNTIINELKENTTNNKNNIMINEEEKIRKYMEDPDLSKHSQIIIGRNNQANIDSEKSKKINTFKLKSDKIYLNNKNRNNNEIYNEKDLLYNKNMINNVNINVNQLIINNKIITSKSRNKDKLYGKIKNDNRIIDEIKEILKEEKIKHNNLKSLDFDSETKNKINKNILDLKSTIQICSNSNRRGFPKLNKINSLAKLTPLSININENKERNYSNLRNRKNKKNNSLLKLGGALLENKGKLYLKQKNTNDDLKKKINFSKIKIGTCNSISIKTNKNYNGIISSDGESGKRRSVSNSKNNYKRFFKSGFTFNFTKDKFNSGLSSPNNSSQKKVENRINDLKYNLQLKEMNYLNNIDIPLKVKSHFVKNSSPERKYDAEKKLKLKKYDCIGIDKIKNIEIFTPRILKKD